MEELLKTLLKESPNIVALLVVVRWFLAALDKRDERYDRLENEHEKAREYSREVIQANTAALAEVMEVIRKCKRIE